MDRPGAAGATGVQEEQQDKPGSKALPFVAFNDIKVEVRKPWILKGALARRETSSWIGGPGTGKSALITEVAVYAASGRDWRGHRSKERCAVVYLAFERADLTLRRLEAYKRKHDLHDIPIVVVRAPVDLMVQEGVEILVDTIKAAEGHVALPVGLVIIDTFAKAIAFGNGDENLAKDQNRLLNHLRDVQGRTTVHLALIGHTGKDATKGARGSNANPGDADLVVQISGDVAKSAVITKANDQAEGLLTTFMLETYSFGLDEDGDPITTAIVSADIPEREAKAPSKRSTNPRHRIALDALTEVLINASQDAPVSFNLPHGTRIVDVQTWRDELFARGALDRNARNPRTDFARLRDALVDKALIGFRDELVWRVN